MPGATPSGRRPRDGADFVVCQPPRGVVVAQHGLAYQQPAPVSDQRHRAMRVGVGRLCHEVAHLHLDAKLLREFSRQRRPVTLAGFYLAAWQLPEAALAPAGCTSGGKEQPVVLQQRSDHPQALHRSLRPAPSSRIASAVEASRMSSMT